MEGTLLAGRFRLLSPLAEGGMGAVWVAEQLPVKRNVAVKLIRSEVVGSNPEEVERFRREATALAALNSPHIVTLFDFGISDDGQPFLAMELIDGPSLSARIRQRRLSEFETIAVLRAVAKALGAAHAEDLVHRDLKPANIVLPGGDVAAAKVLDFGLVKEDSVAAVAKNQDGDALTQEGIILGTPGYIAPEVTLHGARNDKRSDLYAMGVIGFECLAGQSPFEATTSLKLIVDHATKPRPNIPSDINVSAQLRALILRLMSIDVEERFQSAESFLSALDGLSAHPTPSSDSNVLALDQPTESLDIDQLASSNAGATTHSSRRGVVAAVLALLVVAAVAAAFLLPKDPRPSLTTGAEKTVAVMGAKTDSASIIRFGTTLPTGKWKMNPGTLTVRNLLMERRIADRLVYRGPGGEIMSDVLSRFELSNDAKALQLELGDWVRFHPHPTCFIDGRQATSMDLKRTLEAESEALETFQLFIDSVELNGNAGVTVLLKDPAPNALAALRHVLLLPHEYVQPNGCDTKDDLRFPAASGPYRLTSPPNANRIELTRVPEHRASPTLEQLVAVRTRDAKACVSALLSDVVDWCRLMDDESEGLVAVQASGASLDGPLATRTEFAVGIVGSGDTTTVKGLVPVVRKPTDFLASQESRFLLASAIDRDAYVANADLAAMRPLSQLLPITLHRLTGDMSMALLPRHEASRRLKALLTKRQETRAVISIAFVSQEKSARAVCASLDASIFDCSVERVEMQTWMNARDSKTQSNVLALSIVDDATEPFVRINALANFLEKFGVDLSAAQEQPSHIRSIAERQARQRAVEQYHQALLTTFAFIPLAASISDSDDGFVIARKTLTGIFDPITGRVLASEWGGRHQPGGLADVAATDPSAAK